MVTPALMSVALMVSGIFNSSKVVASVMRARYFSMRWLVASPSHDGVQRPKSAKFVVWPISSIFSSGTPAQNPAPISAPTLVPATQSMGTPASRNARNTPMCAMPRANPPASARPTLGRGERLSSLPVANSRNFSFAARSHSRASFILWSSILPLPLFYCFRPSWRRGLTQLCWFCNLSKRPYRILRPSMKLPIQKVVVLGAGTMGARITAHFANTGLPCVLLDIVPPDLKPGAPASERNRFARNGIEAAKKSRPAAFFHASLAEKIAIGNFDDDLARCAEADWIIEVVAENLEIKRSLLSKVAQFRKPGAIVTTNTSGLPVQLIAEGLPDEFQQHWAGTHFFNPPRYLKLVEIIPGPKTAQAVFKTLQIFCDRRLGKGVEVAKEKPNFIANRIGTFLMLNALR